MAAWPPVVRRALRVSHAVRARLAEDVAAAGLAAGRRDYVLLGAGLDTFAWRHPRARDFVVWEIDHPDTQAWKRAALRRAGLAEPANVRFVSADLSATAIGDLGTPARATWNWLGVTMYLQLVLVHHQGDRDPGRAQLPGQGDGPVELGTAGGASGDLLGEDPVTPAALSESIWVSSDWRTVEARAYPIRIGQGAGKNVRRRRVRDFGRSTAGEAACGAASRTSKCRLHKSRRSFAERGAFAYPDSVLLRSVHPAGRTAQTFGHTVLVFGQAHWGP